jgi:hypothetical protein
MKLIIFISKEKKVTKNPNQFKGENFELQTAITVNRFFKYIFLLYIYIDIYIYNI